MLYISREDAELIKTFTLSLKMKNHEKIAAHFKTKFEEEANIKNAYNYGMCMSIYIITDPNDSDKSKHLVEVNKAFSFCLEQNEAWWLPRYLRSEINDGVPDEVVGEADAVNFSILKKIDPTLDRKMLISQQENFSPQYSYFLCPYLSQTRALIRKGDLDGAVKTYEAGRNLVPIKKSPFQISYLTRPFYDSVMLLRKLEKTEIAEEIKETALTLFPNSKNLRMV